MCPEGWDPRTNTKLGFLAHLIDNKGGAREFRKIQKNGKTLHGVMVCDVAHGINTKHGMPMVHR
jgi:hypothetical protein